jgi:hypothetical protein
MDYAVQLMISRQYFSTELSEAMFMMMDARMICREGREAAALVIYDNIATSVTSSINRRMPPSLMINPP